MFLCSLIIIDDSGWYDTYTKLCLLDPMMQILYTFLEDPFLLGLAMFLCANCENRDEAATTKWAIDEWAYGGVGRFVINVDERPLHIGKDLNRILELLANVMCFPQRCARIHDDIDLDEIVWAALA
jgi:hypothetical protein